MGSVTIGVDLHIDDKKLPCLIELAKTLRNGGLAVANGFYLGTGKDDPCLKGIQKFVVKTGLPVLYVHLAFHLLQKYHK